MIEVPRAALIAEDLAPMSEFFSFGTNDLTQMTFGFSRDDVAKFLTYYLKNGIVVSGACPPSLRSLPGHSSVGQPMVPYSPVPFPFAMQTADPFETIDPIGVGQLIKMTVEKARKANPEIEIGVCGEQGGEPKSVGFLNALVDYVSCSPLRVPIARLAAAQAAIKAGKESGPKKHH